MSIRIKKFHFYVIIPARSGSTRLQNKNFREIKEKKSLVHLTIESIPKTISTENICLSTDFCDGNKIAQMYGIKFHQRSIRASSSIASANEVVEEVLNSETFGDIKPQDAIVYLQPTSPRRKSTQISEAMDVFQENNGKSLVSLCRKEIILEKLVNLGNSNNLVAVGDKNNPSRNFQEFKDSSKIYYMPNGSIYIFTVEKYRENGIIPISEAVPYFMNWSDSLDIDTEYDLNDFMGR